MQMRAQADDTFPKARKSARRIVLDLLVERERRGENGDITKLMKRTFDAEKELLSEQERAFVKQLAVGTVERQITLDAVINDIASVKTKAMKAPVRCSLRMGAYQILWLDAVPVPAAVDESVKLVKRQLSAKPAGFVNAVLRRIGREKEAILRQLSSPDTPPGVRFSMPPYLCRLFAKERGEEAAEKIFSAFLQNRPLCIRPDPRLLRDKERYDAWEQALSAAVKGLRHHPVFPALLMIEGSGDVRRLPGYGEGAFAVQDAAGAIAVEAADISPGDHVLDVCAAPGGKALYAAALLNDPSQFLARDISEEKCALLKENAARMRLASMRIEVRDATVFDETSEGFFDIVFCDLPCTGFGVIGRKPEIKYHASSVRTDALVSIQRSILSVASRYVRPGGTLVYSTCTVSRAENEDNVAWFLGGHPFTGEPWLQAKLPGAVRGNVRGGCLQLLPGAEETDGFFIARMRRDP